MEGFPPDSFDGSENAWNEYAQRHIAIQIRPESYERGFTVTEIRQALQISPRTVYRYLATEEKA